MLVFFNIPAHVCIGERFIINGTNCLNWLMTNKYTYCWCVVKAHWFYWGSLDLSICSGAGETQEQDCMHDL